MKSSKTDALARFRELEGRIPKLLEALASARDEKSLAQRDLAEARAQIRRLQAEMEAMRDERLKIRNRVERLLAVIPEPNLEKEEKIV